MPATFATPSPTSTAPRPTEEAPVTTRYLDHDGGTLAYDDSGGPGRPVVLVPGAGDLRAEYRFLTPHLARAGYRVVTLDLRGHGDSSTDWQSYGVAESAGDILALIDHLDAGPAVVVGTSFAPAAALWAAAEAPGKITRLVLISAHLDAAGGGALQNALLGAMMNTLLRGPWKARAWEAAYRSWYPSRKPADLDAYGRRLRAGVADPARARAARETLTASRAGLEARLARVTAPTLVVMGGADSHFKDPAAEAGRIAAAVGGTVRLIDGAGHYPHAEMPDEVAPLLLDFLLEGDSGGRDRGAR